jgi:hypothetical protein
MIRTSPRQHSAKFGSKFGPKFGSKFGEMWRPSGWDVPGSSAGDDSGDESDDSAEQNFKPHEAGLEFADFLLDLKVKGKRLSARDVCVLCHYAKAAGIQGPACDMAFRPNAPTGHYQRHLDSSTELNAKLDGVYNLMVPSYDKYELSRAELEVPSLPMHECLNAEVENDVSVAESFKASLRGKEWTDVYFNHPVVKSSKNDELVYPLAIYTDGVPFQKRDGVLAFYVYNLISGVRHLLLVLRKSQMCKCSCGGWCSLFAAWAWIRWSVLALSLGVFPKTKHNGHPFNDVEDQTRASHGGKKMIKGAVVMIKADWLEYTSSCGLPYWSNVMHPCFCCHATRDQMQSLGQFNALTPPFPEKTGFQYEEACGFCEQWVTLKDKRQHQIVLGALFYDKRKHGDHGRCLSRDIADLQLLQGDRLEPSALLPNIGDYERLTPPCRVLFWRRPNQTIATRRCPLFCPEAGLTIETLTVDPLHTLHLGVYKDFCQTVLWEMILADAWSTGASNQDTLCQVSVQRIRSQLFDWYKMKRRQDPNELLYPLGDLKMTMLGTPNKRCLATKAAETGTLLEFCRDALKSHGLQVLGPLGKTLLAIGEALVNCRNIMRVSPRQMPPELFQGLVDNASRAFNLREASHIPWIPKWHLFIHMAHRARQTGSPALQATFLDESFNGRLAAIASSAHRMTWHRRVLSSFRYAFSASSNKRAR